MFDTGNQNNPTNVRQDLDLICEKYLVLMARCIQDSKFKELFLNDPRPFLENEVGMKIPKNAKIVFDPNGRHWPEVRIISDEVEIDYVEASLSVKEDKYYKTGMVESRTVTRENPEKVTFEIDANPEECKIVVILPFFTSDTDLLAEYKFKNTEDSILLSCC